jgi:hypothetical protein
MASAGKSIYPDSAVIKGDLSVAGSSLATPLQISADVGDIARLVEIFVGSTFEANRLNSLFSRLASLSSTNQRSLSLPRPVSVGSRAVSLTLDVCRVNSEIVSEIKQGECTISYTATDHLGNSFTTEKKVTFLKRV